MNKERKEYWFKRKRYGFGWIPICWKGWLLIIIYLVIVVSGTLIYLPQYGFTESEASWIYFVFVTILSTILVIISSLKGPSLKWRWGKSPDDDPEKDY